MTLALVPTAVLAALVVIPLVAVIRLPALRSRTRRQASAGDHAAVLKVWFRRHRDLGRAENQVAGRLHAVLCEPAGIIPWIA